MKLARLLLGLMLLASPGRAQSTAMGRRALASDSVPASIRDAETQGSRTRHVVPNNPTDSSAENGVGGTRDRRCVNVEQINIVRSGDFIAGPFAYYSDEWHLGYGKIWWQPAYVAEPNAPLTVRASRLDAAGEARVFEQSFITFPVDKDRKRAGPQFYPSGFHVPSVGRWLLVATAGANWGCFVVTVR